MDAVRITDVSKTYGKHTAVSDFSLTVPEGSLYGFIGPNGSGKTTTIRMILRIIQPDRGDIEVLGAPSAEAANDDLGYLPEERGLYKKMTVRRMLSYYAALKGMSRGDARLAIADWLERFDLTPWAKKSIESLSKGMSQKVGLMTPIMLLVIIPMLCLGPVLQSPSSVFARLVSLVPPATPMLMFVRIAIPPGPALWEVVLGVILTLSFATCCVWAAGKVFRIGILSQGQAPTVRQLLQWIFADH